MRCLSANSLTGHERNATREAEMAITINTGTTAPTTVPIKGDDVNLDHTTGASGANGGIGTTGRIGATGSTGATGATGSTRATGSTGSTPDGQLVHVTGIEAAELAFIDPGAPGLSVLLRELRPGVEAILLGRNVPAARQIAMAVAGRSDVAAIHVLAHGAPGRVSFSAGEWTTASLAADVEDLGAIGRGLLPGGELCLWSCRASAGSVGKAFVAGLAKATGATIAAAEGLVGAAGERRQLAIGLLAHCSRPTADLGRHCCIPRVVGCQDLEWRIRDLEYAHHMDTQWGPGRW